MEISFYDSENRIKKQALKEICNYCLTSVRKTRGINGKRYEKIIYRLYKILVYLEARSLTTHSDTLNTSQTAYISLELDKLKKQLCEKRKLQHLSELIEILSAHCNMSWATQAKQDDAEKVKANYAYLTSPGSSYSNEMLLQLTGGSQFARVGIVYRQRKSLSPDPEGLILTRKEKSKGIFLKFTLGLKKILFYISGKGSITFLNYNFKEYNAENFLAHQVDKHAKGSQFYNKQKIRGILKFFHKYRQSNLKLTIHKWQKKALYSTQTFNRKLKASGLDIHVELIRPQPFIPLKIKGNAVESLFSIEAGAGLDTSIIKAGIRGRIAITSRCNKLSQWIPTPLSESKDLYPRHFKIRTSHSETSHRDRGLLRDNHDSLLTIPRHDEILEHGRCACSSEMDIKDRMQTSADDVSKKKHDCYIKLCESGKDITQYHDIVQNIKTNNYLIKRTKDKQMLKQLNKKFWYAKQQIKEKYNTYDRHELLQKLYISFLHNINQLPKECYDTHRNLIDKYIQQFNNPPIQYDKKIIRKTSNTFQRVDLDIKEKIFEAKINFPLFNGSIKVACTKYDKHPSIDRTGEHLTITVTGNCLASIQSILNNAYIKTTIKALLQKAVNQENIPLPDLGNLEFSILPDMSIAGSCSLTIAFFKSDTSYKPDNKFHYQFSRVLKTISASAGISVSSDTIQPISGTIHCKGNITQTKVINEKISPKNLSYTLIRFERFFWENYGGEWGAFNKWKKGDTHIPKWEIFFKNHKSEYKKMFSMLSEPSTAVYQQTQRLMQELYNHSSNQKKKNKIRALKQSFEKSMIAFKNDPKNETLFKQAKEQFEAFLTERTHFWRKKHEEKWIKLPYEKTSKIQHTIFGQMKRYTNKKRKQILQRRSCHMTHL